MKRSREPRPKRPHHTIESVEVTAGFLEGLKLEFADGVNVIVGGRGAGKTTTIEATGWALRDDRSGTSKGARGLVQSNLKKGTVRVRVRNKHGMVYVAEKTATADAPQVFDEQGKPAAVSLDRDLIFKADAYSQNEIEAIAESEQLQLDLLDRFESEEIRRIKSEIGRVERELEGNAAEMLQLTHGMQELEDMSLDLDSVQKKLDRLQKTDGPDAKALEEAHARKTLREREARTLEGLRADLKTSRSELTAAAEAAIKRLELRIDKDVAAGPSKEVFGPLARRVGELTSSLEKSVSDLTSALASVDGDIEKGERKLGEVHADAEAAYQKLLSHSREETGVSKERADLQKRKAEMAESLKVLEVKRSQLRERERQRRTLLEKLGALRDERFALRRGIANTLSKKLEPDIRVEVVQGGGRVEYRKRLKEALEGRGLRIPNLADQLADGTVPRELVEWVREKNASALGEVLDLSAERAGRILGALGEKPELLYQLEIVEVEDRPEISLHDGSYKNSAELSTGQKCTAILPILLEESDRPLLVDQPDDNLDNKFIYQKIVQRILETKGSRQLIFVSHNPNLVVLAEAERVFLLESNGRQGRLTKAGTVDEMRAEIETWMEGGAEAFERRAAKYGRPRARANGG